MNAFPVKIAHFLLLRAYASYVRISGKNYRYTHTVIFLQLYIDKKTKASYYPCPCHVRYISIWLVKIYNDNFAGIG